MKDSYRIFSRLRIGLDYRIWLSILIILFISVLVLSFKVITSRDCEFFEISTSSTKQGSTNIFSVGDTITFSIPEQAGKQFEWNFGDGSPSQKGKNIVQHFFLQKNTFTVSCIVDDKCQSSVLINIIPAFLVANNTVSFTGDPIRGTDTAYIGDTVHYTTPVQAGHYQWSIEGDTSSFPQTTSDAYFTFSKDQEGIQTIDLNIDKIKYQKPVNVLEKISANTNIDGISQQSISIPPQIKTVDPLSGTSGQTIKIRGNYFNGLSAVYFGTVKAAEYTEVSQHEILATVGQGASGDIVVETADGSTKYSSSQFTYIAPQIVAPTINKPANSTTQFKYLPPQDFIKIFNQANVDTSAFTPYLCQGGNTKLLPHNDDTKKDDTWTSLKDFCGFLKKEKKGWFGLEHKTCFIDSVIVRRDSDQCVTSLRVYYKYKKPPKK